MVILAEITRSVHLRYWKSVLLQPTDFKSSDGALFVLLSVLIMVKGCKVLLSTVSGDLDMDNQLIVVQHTIKLC